MGAVKQSLKKARSLKPSRIRQDAERHFRLELVSSDEAERQALSRLFVPDQLLGAERNRAVAHFHAAGDSAAELRVCGPSAPVANAIAVDWRDPEPGLRALLAAHPRYRLALGRTFPPLRELLAVDLIRSVAVRNAALAAISALPEVFPNPLSLVLALGEMGSDTVLLTANQIGLAFELAALHGERVGWQAQAGRVAAIVAGGLGWRTLARELVGLIPAGIGLSAKSAIAYSGTWAVGMALWRVSAPEVSLPTKLPQRRLRQIA
ncbi:MAG TPA: hypothetical protein VFP94_01765 [Terriglobales bacterium]|nr:hypothetical protein [Terriglobales bacterium]